MLEKIGEKMRRKVLWIVLGAFLLLLAALLLGEFLSAGSKDADYTQTVYLTLYVYEGRVVGGDIHSAALNGFMHELRPRPND